MPTSESRRASSPTFRRHQGRNDPHFPLQCLLSPKTRTGIVGLQRPARAASGPAGPGRSVTRRRKRANGWRPRSPGGGPGGRGCGGGGEGPASYRALPPRRPGPPRKRASHGFGPSRDPPPARGEPGTRAGGLAGHGWRSGLAGRRAPRPGDGNMAGGRAGPTRRRFVRRSCAAAARRRGAAAVRRCRRCGGATCGGATCGAATCDAVSCCAPACRTGSCGAAACGRTKRRLGM